jgi:uncharacterized protein
MPILDHPGVYINELTSPGVIAGVGTSTAAFVGPALNGPINVPTLISSFDDFLRTFGVLQADGTYNTYMVPPVTSRQFFMAFAVRSFYDNGGTQAYVVRVASGSAAAAEWDIKNAGNEVAFRIVASVIGAAANGITVNTTASSLTGAAGVALANPGSKVQVLAGSNTSVTVATGDGTKFRVGDIVTKDVAPEPAGATVESIVGDVLQLSAAITGLAVGDTLRIASITPTQTTFRLASTTGIYAGTIANISGYDSGNVAISEPVLVLGVDSAGFVRLATTPARTKTYSMALSATAVPVLISEEFTLTVNVPTKAPQVFKWLSMSPQHPNYVFAVFSSTDVTIEAPVVPPVSPVPQNLIQAKSPWPQTVAGADDNPAAVGLTEYQNGLAALANIQDVNIVTIPDASSNASRPAIQDALIQHCWSLTDRFAVLDSVLGAALSGAGSVAAQIGALSPTDKGYGALYFPWLVIKDPTASGATLQTTMIPPCGAIAGVYARTDNDRGVHKAPANAQVMGVLGLEQVLSDAQQGPLNLLGVDVLRIFPGTSQVTVWGARTIDQAQTDWMYVNVRRLMIYIEQSIEVGLRWAVFEPNGIPLWQRVKRTLNEFLTRVWQSGALFGATADKAFYVRIDEGNNPPATRALGQLNIEIGVAPVRPAEFIVVTIGLWDGGAQITEG